MRILSLTELEERYASMSSDEFDALERANLTEEAQAMYDNERLRRQTPEWLEQERREQKQLSAEAAMCKASKGGKTLRKIEVELPSAETRTFDSTAELREAILKGEVPKSLLATMTRYKEGRAKPDKKWSTVERIAARNADLRLLYRPIWHYTIKYLWYLTIVCFCFQAIRVTTYVSANEALVISFLALIAVHAMVLLFHSLGPLLIRKRMYLLIILVGWSIWLRFGVQTLNGALMLFIGTTLFAFLYGAPLGMILGTVVGRLMRKRTETAPDAIPEGWKPYLFGLLAPVIFLAVIIVLSSWYIPEFQELLQK